MHQLCTVHPTVHPSSLCETVLLGARLPLESLRATHALDGVGLEGAEVGQLAAVAGARSRAVEGAAPCTAGSRCTHRARGRRRAARRGRRPRGRDEGARWTQGGLRRVGLAGRALALGGLAARPSCVGVTRGSAPRHPMMRARLFRVQLAVVGAVARRRAAHRASCARRAASAQRARPSSVRGPVDSPPCMRHRPFGQLGARHAPPVRVLAPQRARARIKSAARVAAVARRCSTRSRSWRALRVKRSSVDMRPTVRRGEDRGQRL